LVKVAIVGVGHAKFGVRSDVSLQELAFEAVKPALEDAKVSKGDVELVSVGCAGFSHEWLPAVVTSEYMGLSGAGLIRCEAACASGGAAFYAAYLAIASGQYDCVLVLGVEKMNDLNTDAVIELIGRAGYYLWEYHYFGVTFPSYYALHATRHMAKYGTTEEQMAMVAVKNHKYASMNPYAHLQRRVTVDEVLSSMVISWPLKLYDCCPISDGAAAIVLASEDKVKELKVETPIWVAGVGVSSDTASLSKREDYVGLKASVLASRKAYKMANVEPSSFDLAEVHDCFTIAEIMAYEDLGFCPKGQGGKMVEEGQTEIGGKIPVNVDGGLKAKGHPLGATGVSMLVEATKQLRGEAGKRQIPLKNYVALVHNVGGTGHYCYVVVLRR